MVLIRILIPSVIIPVPDIDPNSNLVSLLASVSP